MKIFRCLFRIIELVGDLRQCVLIRRLAILDGGEDINGLFVQPARCLVAFGGIASATRSECQSCCKCQKW